MYLIGDLRFLHDQFFSNKSIIFIYLTRSLILLVMRLTGSPFILANGIDIGDNKLTYPILSDLVFLSCVWGKKLFNENYPPDVLSFYNQGCNLVISNTIGNIKIDKILTKYLEVTDINRQKQRLGISSGTYVETEARC